MPNLHFFLGHRFASLFEQTFFHHRHASHKMFTMNKFWQRASLFDFLMLGELFLNDHHKHPNSPNFGVKWWKFDQVYPMLRLFHWADIIQFRKA